MHTDMHLCVCVQKLIYKHDGGAGKLKNLSTSENLTKRLESLHPVLVYLKTFQHPSWIYTYASQGYTHDPFEV